MAITIKKMMNRATEARSLYNTNRRDLDKELCHYIMPKIGKFDDEDTIPNEKRKKFINVIDKTATIAADKLAAAYLALASSPTTGWMRISPKDRGLLEVSGVAAHMDAVNNVVEQHLHEVNAYNSFSNVYRELVVIGTGCLFIDSDPVNVSSYHHYTIGTYYFKVDSKGVPNRWYRFYKDTVDNVVEKFGEANVSLRVRQKIDKEGASYVDLVHIIEPNIGRDATRVDNKNMPFTSVYLEEAWAEGERALRQSGYEDFPVVIPRYDVVGDDSWGQSPSDQVLGFTKALQEVFSDYMSASERTIAPPTALPNSLKGKKLGAGSAFYYDQNIGAPTAQAIYQIDYDFNANLTLQEQLRTQIKQTLMAEIVNAISSIDKRNMTATEVAQRVAEAFQGQVSFVTRVEVEMLTRVVEREYKLLLAAGRFPEPPPELESQPFDIVFISPLAQAQQAGDITAIEQIIDMAQRLSQIDPEGVNKKFNAPQTLDETIKLNGAPSGMLRSDEEVAAMEAAEAEARATAANTERLAQMATSAEQLGNTPMNQDTALDGIMEGIAQ